MNDEEKIEGEEKHGRHENFNEMGCFFDAFDIPYYRMENIKCSGKN
jgi:hypothetical protein